MQTARILILEPDLYDFYDAQKCLADLALVFQATTVDQAWHLIKASDFDLIIFELNLPSSTGFEFCTELKSRAGTRDLPLICASNLNDVTEKVIAFSLGVDDYITKPFIPQEFRARIESKLRKRIQSPNLRFQGLRISLVHQRTEIEANGQMIEIELTPLEFRLLAFLAQNKERVLSRAVILQAVWGDRMHVTDRSIDTHVVSLRRKLGVYGAMIRSVRGLGYRFVSRLNLESNQRQTDAG